MNEALMMLMSTLPKQAAGEVDGILRVEGYTRVLGLMPLEQLAFIRDTALAECEWMPAPAKVIQIANRWRRGDDAVRATARAEAMARRERQARLDDARRALRIGELGQDAIDALPDAWRASLEAEGLLWRCDCGSFCARPATAADPVA